MKEFKGRNFISNKYMENKILFLNDNNFSSYTQLSYFDLLNNNVNYLEVDKGKDLYEFTKDEILDLIKDSATNSQRSKRALFSVINSYIRWSIDVGINYIDNPCDDINIAEVTDISKKAMENVYIEMSDFKRTIFNIFKYSCEADIVIAIMLRYGISIDQMSTIKWEDVDRDNYTVKVNYKNKEYIYLPIDDYFIKWIDLAKECKVFEYEIITKDGKEFMKQLNFIDEGYIIKGTNRTKGGIVNFTTIHNRYNLLFSRSGLTRYKVRDLQKSRRFDLLFCKLKENNGSMIYSDLKEVIKIFMPDSTPANNNLIKTDFQKIANIKITRVRK